MNKVLIVDNDDAIRLLYEEELAWSGYEVISSASWKNLLKTIAEGRPNLIVLEAEIGGLKGLDILQDIRNTYYDLPVILSTTCRKLTYDERCIAADYCVVKSSDLSELKLRIKMAMASSMEPVPEEAQA